MKNRTANFFLNIAKKNIITNDIENEEEIENESQSTNTRVYSDCFASYNVNILKCAI